MSRVLTLFALLPMLVPVSAEPQSSSELLVSAEWLKQNLDDPKLVLLHVGERPQYDSAHIPGARFITMGDVSLPRDPAKLALELPPRDSLRRRLEAFGINDDSRIVVYYGRDWVSPSTRILLALDYAGLGGRASLLNGGMQAWQHAGGAVTASVPAVRHGKLSALAGRDVVVEADFVAGIAKRPGHALVDARAAVFYEGTEEADGKRGHIPGAKSIPFTVVANDELMVDVAALEKAFRDAGVRRGDTVVGYCHVGQQATAMLFAARLLGHDVRLYDGSFQDWSRRGLPVEPGTAKRP